MQKRVVPLTSVVLEAVTILLMIAGTSLGQDRNDRVPFQVTVPVSSLVAHNSVPWKIEADCDDGDGTTGHDETKKDNDGACQAKRMTDDTALDSMKTVLVPVRDPVTRQIKNMLVPVEVRDESGLNIIKSVLIPVHGEDGLVSYEIKRVVVPIRPEVSLPRRRQNAPNSAINRTRMKQECHKHAKECNEKVKSQDGERKRKQEGGKEKHQSKEATKGVDETDRSVPTDAPTKEEEHILDTLRTTCPFCQKRYKDEVEMQKHVRKVHRKPYNCDKCHRGYFTDYALQEHLKTHDVISFYQCTVCQMQYKTTTSLKNHQIREHANVDPKFLCDHCGKRYKLKNDLALHIDRSHMNSIHICRFCGMLVKHIALHEQKHERSKKVGNNGTSSGSSSPPSYRCKFCARTFKAWNSMENHLLMKHKSPKEGSTMLRTLFEKKFESPSDFYEHVSNEVEKKQHKCDTCGKILSNEDNLRNHVALHSQTFLCLQCDKTFPSKYALKVHLRKHTGERPYQCKVCLKTFTRSASLRVHRFTHTGQRPYVCDICGHKFTQRSSMMVHRRKHPGNHPPPPPLILSKLKTNEH